MGGRKRKSRRPSSSRRTAEQHSPFTIVLDENHAATPELTRMLNRLGVCYKTPAECGIARGTSDEALLRIVGRHGWVLLTTDKTIRRNRLELAAAIEHKTAQFVFSNNNMDGATLAEALRRAAPHLKRIWTAQKPPLIVSIGKGGNVKLLYPQSEEIVPC